MSSQAVDHDNDINVAKLVFSFQDVPVADAKAEDIQELLGGALFKALYKWMVESGPVYLLPTGQMTTCLCSTAVCFSACIRAMQGGQTDTKAAQDQPSKVWLAELSDLQVLSQAFWWCPTRQLQSMC